MQLLTSCFTEAVYRRQSAAAHTSKVRPSLAHEGDANRGRLHWLVRLRPDRNYSRRADRLERNHSTRATPRRAQDTTKRGGVTRKGSTQLNQRKAARRELATRFRLRL